jgi:excisionase family DNA binding protein
VPKPITVTPQTPLEDLPQFLTVEEWRTFMRIGRSSAYDLIRRGLVPVIRWGRTVRISREAVRKYITQDGEAKDGNATPGDQPRVARTKSSGRRELDDGDES